MFAPNQLEEKYGGLAPNMEAPFWPPRMASQLVGADESKIISEEDYEEYVRVRPSISKRPEHLKPKKELTLRKPMIG